jgi:hypothetical protein
LRFRPIDRTTVVTGTLHQLVPLDDEVRTVADFAEQHGGYRPAFNVQTVTETTTGLIVEVDVVYQASDNGLGAPMVENTEERTGVPVESMLLGAGYMSNADIEKLEGKGTKVYMPGLYVRKDKAAGRDPYARKRDDTDVLAGWRARMGEPGSQKLYSKRAPVAEGTHACQSNGGFKKFRLRGKAKALAEVLWQALAHNLRVLMKKKWLSGGIIRPQTT